MAYPLHHGKHFGKRTVIVPPTTDMALVFPLDHKNKRFDRSFYSHYLTDGRASNEQVDGFLKEVEGAFKEKLKWIHRFRAFLVFSFITGIFVMTMYSLIIFSDLNDNQFNNHNGYNDQQNFPRQHRNDRNGHNRNFRHHGRRQEFDFEEQVNVMFMGWAFLFFAAIFWAIVYRCAKRSGFKKARRGAQEVIDRYAPVFANSGLRWNAPLAFPHYIELWKDYKGQNFNQDFVQPAVQPVPQHNIQPVQAHVQPNNQVPYNSNPISYNANPLSFNHIYHQLQNQNQTQRYPTFNQTIDQRAVLDFQNQGITTPLLNRHAQRSEGNAYNGPYPINYVSNA